MTSAASPSSPQSACIRPPAATARDIRLPLPQSGCRCPRRLVQECAACASSHSRSADSSASARPAMAPAKARMSPIRTRRIRQYRSGVRVRHRNARKAAPPARSRQARPLPAARQDRSIGARRPRSRATSRCRKAPAGDRPRSPRQGERQPIANCRRRFVSAASTK